VLGGGGHASPEHQPWKAVRDSDLGPSSRAPTARVENLRGSAGRYQVRSASGAASPVFWCDLSSVTSKPAMVASLAVTVDSSALRRALASLFVGYLGSGSEQAEPVASVCEPMDGAETMPNLPGARSPVTMSGNATTRWALHVARNQCRDEQSEHHGDREARAEASHDG
jgi:hypothetical protein